MKAPAKRTAAGAWSRGARLLGAAGLAAMLCACGEQALYGGLSERQANEMVALLRSSGIAADKEARDATSFSVNAPRERFAEAIELLRANGLPREGFESLGQVFKKEGFVSSPLEERARLTYALSQEIANTLASIDGVVVARVHLAVPEKDPLVDKLPVASASVFIKHRPNVDLSGRLGQIKALVVNSIEGLPYDNVTVALFPAEASPAHALPASPLGGLDTALWWLGGAGTLALLAGGGVWAWHRRRPGAVSGATPLSATVPGGGSPLARVTPADAPMRAATDLRSAA